MVPLACAHTCHTNCAKVSTSTCVDDTLTVIDTRLIKGIISLGLRPSLSGSFLSLQLIFLQSDLIVSLDICTGSHAHKGVWGSMKSRASWQEASSESFCTGSLWSLTELMSSDSFRRSAIRKELHVCELWPELNCTVWFCVFPQNVMS